MLGLLETCCDASRLIPSFNTKLPLTPQADACRTARHALRLIATARPAAFITTMAREVARYNALQQNAQTISVPLTQLVLYRAKKEILHCVEMLIDKMQTEMANLLVEVSCSEETEENCYGVWIGSFVNSIFSGNGHHVTLCGWSRFKN